MDLLPVRIALSRLQAWAANNAPEVTFRPPASSAAINNFHEKSRLLLPDDLQQTLRISDGETRKSAGMFGNWRLMPINEIQAAWGLLSWLSEMKAFEGKFPEASPYIRQAWWHTGWIPFITSDLGDYFCLEVDPPDPDRHDQVLIYLQDRPQRLLVASSLRHWLDRIVRDLETGVYRYDLVDGFDGEAFMWSALEGKHLFDLTNGRLVV